MFRGTWSLLAANKRLHPDSICLVFISENFSGTANNLIQDSKVNKDVLTVNYVNQALHLNDPVNILWK